MIWPVCIGRRRGVPPVASKSFSYDTRLPRSSVTLFCFGLRAVARRPRRRSTPIVSVRRQTVFSGSSPFHNPFDSGGRVEGGGVSAEWMSTLPGGSQHPVSPAPPPPPTPPP